jgi:hypothetical protein
LRLADQNRVSPIKRYPSSEISAPMSTRRAGDLGNQPKEGRFKH